MIWTAIILVSHSAVGGVHADTQQKDQLTAY